MLRGRGPRQGWAVDAFFAASLVLSGRVRLERIAVLPRSLGSAAALLALAASLACGARTSLEEATRTVHGDADSNPSDAGQPSSAGVVLFGGMGAANMTLDDTWTWDGTAWTQRAPGSHPSARWSSIGAQQGSVALLFGGVVPYEGGANDENDTWTWDGVTWTTSPGADVPAARDSASAATYQGSLLLYGGLHDGSFDGDTWIWDGHSWFQQSPATSPGGRWGSAAVEVSGEVLLFGGRTYPSNFNDAETWTFSGGSWTQVVTASAPQPRLGHAMATLGSRVVLFGGFVNGANGSYEVGDTWVWDGSTWSEWSGTGPPARSGHSMASFGGRVVMFGGVGTNGAVLGDTWLWDGSTWTSFGGASPPPRSQALMSGYGVMP
jgi:hypothetical protein